MREPMPLLSFNGLLIYPYSLMVALGLGLAIALIFCYEKVRKPSYDVAFPLVVTAVPLGLFFSKLCFFLFRLDFLLTDIGVSFLWHPGFGGFSLVGTFLGVAFASFLVSKVKRVPFSHAADLAAMAGAMVLAFSRFGEAFTLEGLGAMLETESLWRFPFAVQNTYEEWCLPVFLWEGITALLLCAHVAIPLYSGRKEPGKGARSFTLLLGLTQIFLESLRQDEFLRFGFVKVNQLFGITLVMICFFLYRREAKKPWLIPFLAIILLAGGLIAVEFGLDKSSIPNLYLRGFAFICLVAMYAVIGTLKPKKIREMPGSMQA